MKNCLLAIALLTGVAVSAQSKRRADTTTRFFYFSVGYQYQSFKKLSDRVAKFPGFTKPGKSYGSFSFGFNRETDGFMSNANVHFAGNSNGDDEKQSSQLFGGGASYTLGYNFSKKANFRFYPFVGIGVEGYQAKFNKDVSAIAFDSILLSNNTQQRTEPVVFTNTFFCYEGGLAAEYINTKSRLLHSIGLRLSYTGSFKSRSWRVNDNRVIAGAPSDKISQFNASLLFGVGRKRAERM